jgi:hypothetical protein
MIPARLLPHTVTVTAPARVTDEYGNEVLDYDAGVTRQIRAYVQPRQGEEDTTDRNAVARAWVMFSTESVDALERVTYAGRTYNVDGPSRAWDAPAGAHHHETNLTLVEG